MKRKKIFLFLGKTTSDLNSLMTKINKCLSCSKKGKRFAVIVPSESILGRMQVVSAAEKAFESFRSKDGLSKKLEIEFLLYLYGTSKIDEALKIANCGKRNLLIACSEKEGFLKCLKKVGLKESPLSFEPDIAKAKIIYGGAAKVVKGKISPKKLELAVIEKQAMLLAGIGR
ncbi:MAG: KEOPS complex subunit Cgi121 [Candidatus Diapherotrites archaeon]